MTILLIFDYIDDVHQKAQPVRFWLSINIIVAGKCVVRCARDCYSCTYTLPLTLFLFKQRLSRYIKEHKLYIFLRPCFIVLFLCPFPPILYKFIYKYISNLYYSNKIASSPFLNTFLRFN